MGTRGKKTDMRPLDETADVTVLKSEDLVGEMSGNILTETC